MNLKQFMGLGFKPVYLAAIMVNDSFFRAVTINSLFSSEVTPRKEEVGFVFARKSRFLDSLSARKLFSVGLLNAFSEQEARFFASYQRANLELSAQPSWTEVRGVPIFSQARASISLELDEIISRNENCLVLARIVEFISGVEGVPLHYGRAEDAPTATYGALG